MSERALMLRARGLTRCFEELRAVDQVDLELSEGEVQGLLGPNGAGKTTLLRMLLGLIGLDAGEIELLGRGLQDPRRLDGVAGFVEEPGFYPYLSARANLEVLARLDGPGAGGRIGEALAQVELTERADARVAGYSTGMRKRLAIAAALTRLPRLLLLDEPTAGLDPAGVRFIGGLLRSLSDEGVAVLVSSHQIGEVADVCDSFTVLSRGRAVWQGSAARMHAEAPPSAYRLATADDDATIELGSVQRGVQIERTARGELLVAGEQGALDAFVLGLAKAGVAIRRLELAVSPLESMFFALTEQRPTNDSANDDQQSTGALAEEGLSRQ